MTAIIPPFALDQDGSPSPPPVQKLALEGEFAGIELAYLDWHPSQSDDVALCVHGLTRNAHDFDYLSASLAGTGMRVIAVDIVGRGDSSWLTDPGGYAVPVYAAHLKQFCERLELNGVNWIGTSMGGLIGMALAAVGEPLIRRLVLNDIGPLVPKTALVQIQSYLGLDLAFADLAGLERHLRSVHVAFGQLTDGQWQYLAAHGGRKSNDGWRLNYDPAIKQAFAAIGNTDIDLWDQWDSIACPTYLLHGLASTILSSRTVDRMQKRGPGIEVAQFPAIGHAPALIARDQILTIHRWLGRL